MLVNLAADGDECYILASLPQGKNPQYTLIGLVGPIASLIAWMKRNTHGLRNESLISSVI